MNLWTILLIIILTAVLVWFLPSRHLNVECVNSYSPTLNKPMVICKPK